MVTAEPTVRVKATTVGRSMACLLANATAVGGVAAALVGTVWWAVGGGADAETRYARAVCALAGLGAIGLFVFAAGMVLSATNSWSRGTAVRALSLAVPATLPLVVWAAYFQLGGAAQSASAYAVVSTLVVSITATALLAGLHIGSTIRVMPANEASRNAQAALHGIADFGGSSAAAPAQWSWRKAAVGAVKGTLPALFAIAVAAVYVFGIFAAYRKAEWSGLKTGIYVVAVGLKIVGNKAQLWLMQRMPHLSKGFADQFCFGYEYATALLVRVLVLSMPDIGTAQLLSMANSVVEVKVRSHFVVKYLVAGTRLETDEERTAWKERGIWRVLDGNNDNTSTPLASSAPPRLAQAVRLCFRMRGLQSSTSRRSWARLSCTCFPRSARSSLRRPTRRRRMRSGCCCSWRSTCCRRCSSTAAASSPRRRRGWGPCTCTTGARCRR